MITPTDNPNLQYLDSESDQMRLASMNIPAQATTQTPIAMLDDLLRGRWKVAIGLGVILAGLCGAAGFRFAPVRYSSIGKIHVAPTGTFILNPTEDTGRLQSYPAFVGTQAQLVKSPRVIDGALKDPVVSKLPFDCIIK